MTDWVEAFRWAHGKHSWLETDLGKGVDKIFWGGRDGSEEER